MVGGRVGDDSEGRSCLGIISLVGLKDMVILDVVYIELSGRKKGIIWWVFGEEGDLILVICELVF